jgi:hypothetical protein
MTILSLTVTQEDIDNSTQHNTKECALALALRRTTKQPVFVRHRYAYVGALTKSLTYRLPDRATSFIEAFDTDRSSVKPSTFTLEQEE